VLQLLCYWMSWIFLESSVSLTQVYLSGVFCVADSGVLQDTFLWNSMGMHTCSVWFSNSIVWAQSCQTQFLTASWKEHLSCNGRVLFWWQCNFRTMTNNFGSLCAINAQANEVDDLILETGGKRSPLNGVFEQNRDEEGLRKLRELCSDGRHAAKREMKVLKMWMNQAVMEPERHTGIKMDLKPVVKQCYMWAKMEPMCISFCSIGSGRSCLAIFGHMEESSADLRLIFVKHQIFFVKSLINLRSIFVWQLNNAFVQQTLFEESLLLWMMFG